MRSRLIATSVVIFSIFASYLTAQASTPAPIDSILSRVLKSGKSREAKNLGNALAALQAKKFERAITLASAQEKNELFSDYSRAIQAVAHRYLAESNFHSKRYDGAISRAVKAVQLYSRIEENQPYSPLIKKLSEEVALTEIIAADSYAAKKNWKEALRYYERAFQRLAMGTGLGLILPESIERFAKGCKLRSTETCGAWIYRLATIHPKASEEYRTITKTYPEALARPKPAPVTHSTRNYRATDPDLVLFDQGMSQYLEGDYSKANSTFKQFIDEFPRSSHRFRARYWLAQTWIKDKENEKAQGTLEELIKDSPLTYYGYLASLGTGKSLDQFIDATLPVVTNTDPYLYPNEIYRLNRATRFLAENVYDLAYQELKDFRSRNALSSPFLLYLATLQSRTGAHLSSFILLSELIQRGYSGVFTSHGLRLIFPVVHYDLIQKHSKTHGLDPILVLSLIKQESAFETSAASHVGASGLMQLMPATAVDTDRSVKRAHLIQADTSIRIGTTYLKKMLDRYNGNLVFAVAAYNAGPGAVSRWIREKRAEKGMLEFIESIPYKETRDYVSSIIRNHYWYSKRLTDDGPKTLSYFWAGKDPGVSGAASMVTPATEPEPAETGSTASEEAGGEE